MVVYEVDFKGRQVNEKARKEASKVFTSATLTGKKQKSLNQSEFVSFKRIFELYLKKMKLEVKVKRSHSVGRRSSIGTQASANTERRLLLAGDNVRTAQARLRRNQARNELDPADLNMLPPGDPTDPDGDENNVDVEDNEENAAAPEAPVRPAQLHPDDLEVFHEARATHDSYFIRHDLHAYCRMVGRQPADLLVDSLDPRRLPHDIDSSDTVFLKLSPEADEIIGDDILLLRPPDLNYLSKITGDFRTNRIIRQMGRSYYLALDSRRKQLFRQTTSIQWDSGESILDFNNRFELLPSECNELDLLMELLTR